MLIAIIYLSSVVFTLYAEFLYWKKHPDYSHEETLGDLVNFLLNGWIGGEMPMPMPLLVVFFFPIINVLFALFGLCKLILVSGKWRNKKIK